MALEHLPDQNQKRLIIGFVPVPGREGAPAPTSLPPLRAPRGQIRSAIVSPADRGRSRARPALAAAGIGAVAVALLIFLLSTFASTPVPRAIQPASGALVGPVPTSLPTPGRVATPGTPALIPGSLAAYPQVNERGAMASGAGGGV